MVWLAEWIWKGQTISGVDLYTSLKWVGGSMLKPADPLKIVMSKQFQLFLIVIVQGR